ncbi:hypothetical protein Tco_0603930 [Tanacetum coccineum]
MNKETSEQNRTLDFKALDSHNIELTEHVTVLQEQNERFRAENDKVKQHYKEFKQFPNKRLDWSKPRSNTKNNRILSAKSDNRKKVEDHPRNNKSNLKQKNRVDSSISSNAYR